jgi:hypothetical protein
MVSYRVTLSKDGKGCWTQSRTFRVSGDVYNALLYLLSNVCQSIKGD